MIVAAVAAALAGPASAQEKQDDLRKRVEALEKKVAEQEKALAAQAEKEKERDARISDLIFAKDAGARQKNEEGDPLEALPRVGKDLKGNVYSSDNFRIRLGGSLRLHAQWNSTPVPESVSKALLPDPTLPGGGTDRESFRAFAGRSRVSLAVQGPDTLGGQTSGFFEMDFATNLSGGESGAVAPNPRLRHAYFRWTFSDVAAGGDNLVFTFGQTGSSADLIPDTVDFNTMLNGLGAAHRRNPRVEVVHRLKASETWTLGYGVGAERPFFGNDFIASDLGPGDLSGYPAFSAGLGVRSDKRVALGERFGIGSAKIAGRATYGEFVERFEEGTLNPDLGLQAGFDEREFQNVAAHGGFVLERIGFNPEGRALTLLPLGGRALDQRRRPPPRREPRPPDDPLEKRAPRGGLELRRLHRARVLLPGRPEPSLGRGRAGRDRRRPAGVTGSFDQGFFRERNLQSELSLWWTPGPFTFALAWNHTRTYYRSVDLALVRESRAGENDKIEFIAWFSF